MPRVKTVVSKGKAPAKFQEKVDAEMTSLSSSAKKKVEQFIGQGWTTNWKKNRKKKEAVEILQTDVDEMESDDDNIPMRSFNPTSFSGTWPPHSSFKLISYIQFLSNTNCIVISFVGKNKMAGYGVLEANKDQFANAESEIKEEEEEEEEGGDADEEPKAKKIKWIVKDNDAENDSIEAQLAKLEKQRAKRYVLCGIFSSPTSIIVTDKGDTFLKCINGCKFPWQTLKQAGQTHVAACHPLEARFCPNKGGAIPRCLRHREIAALMSVEKFADEETAAIKGHLFLVCTKAQKDGGPCMNADGGQWSMVADVAGKGAVADKKRKMLENLLALDGALRKKRNEDAQNTEPTCWRRPREISSSVSESLRVKNF